MPLFEFLKRSLKKSLADFCQFDDVHFVFSKTNAREKQARRIRTEVNYFFRNDRFWQRELADDFACVQPHNGERAGAQVRRVARCVGARLITAEFGEIGVWRRNSKAVATVRGGRRTR